MVTLKANIAAYWDTFAGLVPVHVDSITEDRTLGKVCKFTVTKDHGPYKKGESLERSSLWIVPKDAIQRRTSSTTIGHYTVEASSPVQSNGR